MTYCARLLPPPAASGLVFGTVLRVARLNIIHALAGFKKGINKTPLSRYIRL